MQTRRHRSAEERAEILEEFEQPELGLTITALSEHAMSQIPVKEGAELTPAISPEWVSKRVAEIEALASELGSDSLQRKGQLPVLSG